MTVGDIEEVVTFETAKGRFYQTRAADDLLTIINNEILKSGGRVRMGYYITHKEAPEWFEDSNSKKHFNWAMGSLLYNLNKNATNGKSRKTWTEDDEKYLEQWWTKLDYNIIAENLGKSKNAVRAKAKELLSPEVFEARFYNRTKAGELYNQKYGHHARQIQRNERKRTREAIEGSLDSGEKIPKEVPES